MSHSVFNSILAGSLALLFSLAAYAQEELSGTSPCFSARDWVGKYPDASSGAHGRFLDLPCVRGPLQAMLPPAEYRSLRSRFRVDSPIEILGRFMIVARCEAHNCPAHHAMVVIDSESADIVVGVYRREAAKSRTTWYSTQVDPLQLPPEVLAGFLKRHSPR